MKQPALRTPHRCFAITAALICFAAALGAGTPKWKSYSYPVDGFSASFPSAPQEDQKSQFAAAGFIELHSYCTQLSATDLCVIVFDHAAQATGLDPDALLDLIKQGALAGAQTQKLSETPIALDGHKGVVLETESGSVHTSTRIYLVGDTVYQTMVTSPVADKYAGTTRFLDSFRLIRRDQSQGLFSGNKIWLALLYCKRSREVMIVQLERLTMRGCTETSSHLVYGFAGKKRGDCHDAHNAYDCASSHSSLCGPIVPCVLCGGSWRADTERTGSRLEVL